MDPAKALRSLGFGARAARIERCGSDRRWCNDRLCPKCRQRWATRHFESIRAIVPDLDAATVVNVTLMTWGAGARPTLDQHRASYERFRARTPWALLGAVHMKRTPGGWLAHTHLLVFGCGGFEALAAAIRSAWTDAGGNREAWTGEPQTVLGALHYAIFHALDPPDEPRPLRAWVRAIQGVRLVVRSRAGRTNKRDIPLATPQIGAAQRERIAARVLAIVGEVPHAACAIRHRLTSGDRSVLESVIGELARDGRIVPVRGERGIRWGAS